MRVLHVIPSLDPRDGGPSVALPLMARSLAMQGITVEVATTISEEDARDQGVRFGVPVGRDGFTLRFFKRQTGFYKTSLPLLRWLNHHVRDYALVHTHAVFSFAPLAGAWAARRRGVPCLVRPLGLLNEWGMKHRRRWIKALSFRLLDGPALNHAAAVHYTSTEEQREARRLNLKSRAVVVPLGIDTQFFRSLPDKEVFHAKFPATRGKPVVLFVSRLDPKKGVELLLAAFADARKAEPAAILVIAGTGAAEYEAKVKALAESLHLEGHVIWAGFLGGADKLSAYSAASLFVLPSYSENFGIALAEAMAAGVACISSDRVAAAAEAGDAVEVVPCEKEPLRAAMVRLLQDGPARVSLGHRASATAERLWSLGTTGARLAEIYRNLTHEVRKPSEP